MMSNKKIIFTFLVLLVILYLIKVRSVYFSNYVTENKFFYVNQSDNYKDLLNKLKNEFKIPEYVAFNSFCKKKKLYNYKPGKYLFKKGFSLNEIINELRIPGNRKTVNFSFNSFSTLNELASKISLETSIDSSRFIKTVYSFNYDSIFNREVSDLEIQTFFIPNTYNLYWHISEYEFINKMINEYMLFWSKRLNKAKKINLTEFQVSILASIVEKESNNIDEMPEIASLYLNRLRKKMKLQADPTVNFCFKMLHSNDTTLKRVLNKHLTIDCNYNTYKIDGLPPGPITTPSIFSIDAVLKNKKTNHLFMCAKAVENKKEKKVCFFDSHIFSKNYFQHIKNAKKYQNAMNKYEKGYQICFPDRGNCNCN